MKNNFYRILSIILSLTMIFSVCGIAASADTTTFGENAYFVKNGGTGDGTSEANPAPTVYAAVETINKTLGKGDVANIYIMQREDWDASKGELIGKDSDGVVHTPEHEMAAWKVDGGAVPPHEAEIVIQAYDKNITTYLACSDKLGQNVSMVLGGPTTFKDITLVSVRVKTVGVEFAGNDVTFGEGTKYGYINKDAGWSASAWNGVVGNSTAIYNAAGDLRGTVTITDKVNVTYENEYISDSTNTSLYINNKTYSKYTYKEDYNLTFNNSNSAPIIYLGDGHTNTGIATFDKNFNINIKSADSVTVNGNTLPFTVNGGYQVIISGGATYTGDVSAMSNVTVNGGAWYITNESDDSDLLTFTDTAGTYAVKSGCAAVATDVLGNKYYSANGVLTLDAGEYTVDEYVEPVTKNYYVKYGGTGNGKSADSPVATVYDAVNLVNADNLGENDIANIYILQDEKWNTLNANDETKLVGKIDGAPTTVTHAITAWAENGNAVPNHKAQIVVQAYDASVKTHIAYSANIGQNVALQLGGPTTFKDIVIVC